MSGRLTMLEHEFPNGTIVTVEAPNGEKITLRSFQGSIRVQEEQQEAFTMQSDRPFRIERRHFAVVEFELLTNRDGKLFNHEVPQ